MSTTKIKNIEVKLVNHVICEINMLKRGEVSIANRMMKERVEAENRVFAMKCLIAEDDSENDNLISYIYEQTKELVSKLILSY